MKWFISALLLYVGLPLAGWGAEITAAPKPHTAHSARLRLDTGKVQVRQLDPQQLKKYRAGKEFQYNDAGGYLEESLWDRFWRWFWGLFTTRSSRSAIDTFFKVLFITFGVSAVVFGVLKLMGMDPVQLFMRKPKGIGIPYGESLENIHEISFEEEIQKAVDQRNYRLAVRLLYLNCLKQLSDSGMIHWQSDKTNAVYVNELVNAEVQRQFRVLTVQFEYIWYGNFPVSDTVFGKIRETFRNFNARQP